MDGGGVEVRDPEPSARGDDGRGAAHNAMDHKSPPGMCLPRFPADMLPQAWATDLTEKYPVRLSRCKARVRIAKSRPEIGGPLPQRPRAG